MLESVIELIKQRMAELGYTHYHFEAVRIQDAAASFNIAAYNEYYFLVSKTVPADLQIVSDTEAMTTADSLSYANFNLYGNTKGFSGLIQITQTPAIDHEFIRVVPTRRIALPN